MALEWISRGLVWDLGASGKMVMSYISIIRQCNQTH